MRLRIGPLADGTAEVDIKTLPDGRTLVHWLEECSDGPVVLENIPAFQAAMKRTGVGRYRVACRPQQNTVASQKRGSVRYMCMTSGDVEAATCPNCLATPAAIAAFAAIEALRKAKE